VARKNASPAPTRPARGRVDQHIQRGEWTAAYSAARLLHADQPTAEHLDLLKRVILQTASVLIDGAKTSDFNKLMSEAAEIDAANPAWAVDQACLLARGGRLADALMRVEEPDRLRILGHGADRAVRSGSKEFLPDELHAGFDSILAAFAHYERSEDDAARAALEPIGLRSPFLEWKVLLRGLLAHAANDDARAAENFARLNPERLPHRLAEPYRVKIDAAFLPPNRDTLLKRYEKLNGIGIVESLREIAKQLGRDRPLKPALRAAGEAEPLLKRHLPHLLPRLAACLQQAIIRQGEPEDLAAFRRLFVPAADDPSFFKLQARIAEEIEQIDVAVRNWTAYESWLAAKPAGWPESLLRRVRAHIWHHMGVLQDTEDKTATKIVEQCYARAVELAPDWAIASRDLFGEITDQERYADAEQVARAFLTHQPDAIDPLLSLADNLRKQHRFEESLAFFKRARAVNPLDATYSMQTAFAAASHARALLYSGKPAEAAACLEAEREVLDKHLPSHCTALLAVIAQKRGNSEDAARLLGLLDDRHRLADLYRISIDSLLAKLKPAIRKAADAAFAGALNEPVGPLALLNLLIAWSVYQDDGHAYRGHKTHEKKFLALVPDTVAVSAPELEFEMLGSYLVETSHDKIATKYLDKCIVRFPKNPHLLVMRVELGLELETPFWKLQSWLERAREFAERSKDERDRGLLPRINELLRQMPDPFSLLDKFFSGRF
jgi:hypothetical protein